MKAIIMMGLPGSGKTTWIKNNYPDAMVSSADHYHMDNGVYNWQPSQVADAHAECLKSFLWNVVNSFHVVVCDNTNTTTAELAPYVAIAQAFGYEVEIVCVSSPRAFERQTHGVPRAQWEAMHMRLCQVYNEWPRHWPEPKCVVF